jgi:hypothetical protein
MPLGSTFARDAVLNATLGATQHASIPPTFYLALFAGDPGAATPGVEVSGPGYARVPLPAASSWSPSSSGVKLSAADVSFPASTGAWLGTATHLSLMDAATGGNRWDTGPLGSAITVSGAGTVITFLAGAITVTEA